MRSDIKERRYECKDNVAWELEDWLCQTIRIASRILITIPLILTRFDQRLSTRDRKKVHKYEVPFVGSWVLRTCANTSRRRCYGSKQNTITKKSFHVHESNVPRLWETRETREIRCWLKYVIEDPMDGVVGQDFRRSNSSLAYLAAVMTIGVEKKDYNFGTESIYTYISTYVCVYLVVLSQISSSRLKIFYFEC